MRLSCMRNIAAAVGLLIAIFATCLGCGAVVRTFAGQYGGDMRPAVRVNVQCDGTGYNGSGFVVGRNEVITAAHVIACPSKPIITVTMFPGMQDEDIPGSPLPATVDVLLPAYDLVRLKTPGYLTHGPLLIASPRKGAIACVSAASPQREYSCGVIDKVRDSEFEFSAIVHKGNSGSAVYNEAGQLIGVALARRNCRGLGVCGGLARRLDAKAWLVP